MSTEFNTLHWKIIFLAIFPLFSFIRFSTHKYQQMFNISQAYRGKLHVVDASQFFRQHIFMENLQIGLRRIKVFFLTAKTLLMYNFK